MIPRMLPDIAIDNIVTALKTFSVEQATEDPAVAFNVERDRLRPVSKKLLPFVNVWMDSVDPQSGGSSGRVGYQDKTTFNLDLFTKGSDDDCDGLDENAAMARLYYLAEQVRYGLFKLVNADLGLTVGKIGRKTWPRFQIFQNELKLPESEIVGGRITFEIEYSWIPEDVTGEALALITVDATKWAADYDY